MRRFLILFSELIFVALSLPGCGERNLPFAHKAGNFQEEARPLPDAAGVVLMGVDNAPAKTGTILLSLMEKALAERQIPAGAGDGNNASYYLRGYARTRPGEAGDHTAEIDWDLFRGDGTLIVSQKSSMAMPVGLWREAANFSALVESAADTIAAALQGADSGPSLPAIRVTSVTGEPEGAPPSLMTTMGKALRKKGMAPLETTSNKDRPPLLLSGSVTVSGTRNAKRVLSVSWHLFNSRGDALGRLDQRNTVPSRRLTGRGWTGLSKIIAENAADGIADLIENLPPGAISGSRK